MLPQTIWTGGTSANWRFPRNGESDSSQLKPFGEEVDEAIRQHAVDEYPNECCGLIVDGAYIRCENVSDNPTREFEISDTVLQTFANRIQGVAHSHTIVMPFPSKLDMEQQELWDVPWAIATVVCDGDNPPICADLFWFGDSLPRLPLEGRYFRPSIQDCYALVRDWYSINKGVSLPIAPRDNAWWMDDKNTGRKKIDLFSELLQTSGWKRISNWDLREGDAFAVPYMTEIPCHCGIFVGENEVLHHMSGKLSDRVPAWPWIRRAVEGGRLYRHESME